VARAQGSGGNASLSGGSRDKGINK
jgi:hypothetical protein